jgi:DUF4097 and DUF4098 domain-containing protein YvlB
MNATRILRTGMLIAVAAMAMAAVAGASTTPIDRTLPIAADGTVSVSNVSGSVTFQAVEGKAVHITGTYEQDVEAVEIDGDEDGVDIEVKLDTGHRRISHGDCILTIQLPASCGIEAETMSADIDVNGITGAVEAQSVSGNIAVDGRPKSLEAESVSGTLLLSVECEDIDVSSVSGDILLSGAADEADLETVSGDITVTDGRVGSIDAESVSGDLSIDTTLSSEGSYDLTSHSGNVTLIVPAGTGASFDVSTFSGDITSDIGSGKRDREDFDLGESLYLETGDGSASVSIETFSGDAILRSK